MDTFRELVQNNRSYRRFDNSVKIENATLLEWIDIARLTPSARNQQPLKYMVITETERNNDVFKTLSWAGFLTDWQGPEPTEQPTAYIVILHDKAIAPNCHCDHGIVAQTIMLAATNDGFGGCILAAINRPLLAKSFNIPENFEIMLVLALGKPNETIVTEPMVDNRYSYYRDENDVHHVPKRNLKELIFKDK
jgi:nitroreductase